MRSPIYSTGPTEGSSTWGFIFGQFAVEPELQNNGIGGLLIEQVEGIAKSRKKEELALDTSEKATHLIDYYQKKGFRHVAFMQWDRVNYRSVIMSKRV